MTQFLLIVGIYFQRSSGLWNLILKRSASSKHPKLIENNYLYGSMHTVFTYMCLICPDIEQVILIEQYNINSTNLQVQRGLSCPIHTLMKISATMQCMCILIFW